MIGLPISYKKSAYDPLQSWTTIYPLLITFFSKVYYIKDINEN